MGLAWVRQRLKGAWFRNVLTLMSGTVFAQILPVVASPILTRLYSTSDFGYVALFMCVTAIASQCANLRYPIAIMVGEDDDDGFALLSACLWLTALVSLACGVILSAFYFADVWNRGLHTPVLLAVSVLFLGSYEGLYVWMNRNRRYGSMARSRVIQSIVTVVVSIGLGWSWSGGPNGLIYGLVAGQGAALGALTWLVWSQDRPRWRTVSWQSMRTVVGRYRRFPIVTLPATMLNALTNQLPVIVLTAFFSPAAAGLFSLTNRALIAPTSLIATAIRDVFKERAARDYEKHGTCRPIYVKTMFVLLSISVPLFVGVAVVAPPLFAFVFGEEWRESGYYARYLAPLFIARFAASPLGYVFFIAKQQKYDLMWQIALVIGATVSLVAGALMESARTCVLLYSICYTLAYLLYLLMSYRLSDRVTRSDTHLPGGSAAQSY